MYNSFEVVFLWRKCSTVEVVPLGGINLRANVIFACGWIGLLVFMRNEKKQCANYAWIAKSVTEKNNCRVDCAEATKKTVQAQSYEGRGFFVAGDFALRSYPLLSIR